MLKFDVTYTHPQHHFIDFTFYIDNNKEELLKVQLPSWRPGRYEIGNFAQYVQQVKVFNSMQEPLEFEKITKDCWEIKTKGEENIVIRYRFYANILNAGSSYLDEEQLYLNPVNCFMYPDGRINEEIRIQFIIPGNYHIATQLPKLTKHTLIAANFDELADSPLIASASLKHLQYRVDHTDFHIWFQGNVVLDEKRIIDDFVKFTVEQIRIFGDCECKDYLFLMQMLPVDFHHGVEHKNSSVNALGPGTALMEPALYTDFLGLCSHELFHLWNVKRIRPTTMLPYNFKQENYSNMGYVYEGITTYYGDLVLLRSGVYSMKQFCIEINAHLQKHFHNYGRYNQSLADSSVDTWLDGYRPGIPERKVNIYTEGLLAALILDALCISQTEGEYRLDDMLSILYTDYYKKGKGYEEDTWKACIEGITGHRYDWYFKEIIHGCGHIEKYLDDAIKQIGLQLKITGENFLESSLGIKIAATNGKIYINQVAPDSEAYSLGIAIDDIIIAINTMPLINSEQLNEIFKNSTIYDLVIVRNDIIHEFSLTTKGRYFMKYELQMDPEASPTTRRNFLKWSGVMGNG